MGAGILSGLRVVEISAFIAAPLGGATLAAMGADVIRVDPPGGGVDIGRWPLNRGRSLYWAGLNQGKRSVTIDMRHALTVALQSFEGGMVIVSHDRHLIKTVADSLWLVADGTLEVFDGDLDDYQQWLKTRAKTEQAGQLKPASTRKAPRDSLVLLRRELEQIERRIRQLEIEREALRREQAAV